MVIYTLLYLKWISAKGCFIAHESLLNVMWQPKWEGVWGRMDACIHTAEFLCCSPGAIVTLIIDGTPRQNQKIQKKKKIMSDTLGAFHCSLFHHWSFLLLHVVCWWTLLVRFFSSVIAFFNSLLYNFSLLESSLTSKSVHPIFWILWTSLWSLPWTPCLVDCLSSLHIFFLGFYSDLWFGTSSFVVSLCLNCCFHCYVFGRLAYNSQF